MPTLCPCGVTKEPSLRSTVTLDEILTTPECRERALACAAQSGKGTQAAYYFDAYFKKRYEEGKGVQDESYDFNETAFLICPV